MKNCDYFIDLMSPYFDDLLDKSKQKELEEHLLTCGECNRIFAELRRTVEYCRDISEEELPPDFDKLLHEKLLEEKGKMKDTVPVKRFKRILPIAASVAAGLLVIFSISLFLSSRNSMSNLKTASNEAVKKEKAATLEDSSKTMNKANGSSESSKDEAKNDVKADTGVLFDKTEPFKYSLNDGENTEKHEQTKQIVGDVVGSVIGTDGNGTNPSLKSKETASKETSTEAGTGSINVTSETGETNITITTKDMAKVSDLVASISVKEGGNLETANTAPLPGLAKSAPQTADNSADFRLAMGSSNQKDFTVRIPLSKYDEFKESLKKELPGDVLKFDDVKLNITSEKQKELEKELQGINSQSNYGSNEKNEQQSKAVEAQLDELKRNEGNVIVHIKVENIP